MTRTLGSAIGALIILLFMAHIATRLATPVGASSTTSHAAVKADRR